MPNSLLGDQSRGRRGFTAALVISTVVLSVLIAVLAWTRAGAGKGILSDPAEASR